MKLRTPSVLVATLLLLCGATPRAAAQAAASPGAFTYQGRLLEGGTPAQGAHDLRFSLFAGGTGGTPLAASLTNPAVVVGNGVFTTTLDFGVDALSGAGGWLEIAVRPGNSDGEFTILHPRQKLTPSPYSIFTLKAASLAGPLPDSQLSTNVARLDTEQVFRSPVTFAGGIRGDGSALSNVVATRLSARQMERLWRIPIPFVTVTNAGNPADVSGKGAVAYDFRIGKYEVNNIQYAAFLNAVAADDPHSLYDPDSAVNTHSGIERSGAAGEYFYTVKPGLGHRPAVLVDFYDVLRFCNWLHHGQPSGAQDATTTEDGAYTLTPEALAAENVLRNPGARYWLPSDDEWYKAAYHQPADQGGDFGDYWPYPYRNIDAPISEPPPGGANSANTCCETGRRATDVGAYAQSRTFYDTYDQGGNVQEWTEWTSEFQPLRNRRIRGGSWYYNESYTGANDYEFDTTDYDSESIGFRVAGRVER
jgi:formylglycine-generating enzyme required for sulfatase activity